MAANSKVQVAGVAVSNPAEGMFCFVSIADPPTRQLAHQRRLTVCV